MTRITEKNNFFKFSYWQEVITALMVTWNLLGTDVQTGDAHTKDYDLSKLGNSAPF